uniref:Uncharacterized protein n=1 Tax=Anopheles atroparvus TaxID=41427 RepID=A0AAG5DIA4_ANOAO
MYPGSVPSRFISSSPCTVCRFCRAVAPTWSKVSALFYIIHSSPFVCIQSIAGDVAGVPKRLIALDVLNLLHEEFDDTRLHFATRYLQLMRRFSLYGFLRPTEIRAIIAPYLALPKIFPEPDVRHTFAAKSMVLLELFLLANLLNDPQGLAEELQRACAEFRATPAGKQQP